MSELYQHIQIFGGPGHFIVRPDNDADAERSFRTYNAALAWTVGFLAQAMEYDDPGAMGTTPIMTHVSAKKVEAAIREGEAQ